MKLISYILDPLLIRCIFYLNLSSLHLLLYLSFFNFNFYLNIILVIRKHHHNGDWGLGDWGLGIGDWAQSPIPNPQSPIPNPQFRKNKEK